MSGSVHGEIIVEGRVIYTKVECAGKHSLHVLNVHNFAIDVQLAGVYDYKDPHSSSQCMSGRRTSYGIASLDMAHFASVTIFGRLLITSCT